MHSFDIYLGYIGNYKVAMETILKCRQANQQFSSIMDQVGIFLVHKYSCTSTLNPWKFTRNKINM